MSAFVRSRSMQTRTVVMLLSKGKELGHAILVREFVALLNS